jgi:hypothetical protein
MSIENFRNLTGQTESIVDLLAMPGAAEIEAQRSNSAWERKAGLG